jgi:hypothetical protein
MNLPKLKRWFVGRPIATAQAHHERLGKVTGLAVFASDHLSSVAYATEEILRVLLLAGVGALTLSVPIGLLIGLVIGIVILSYRQNIAEYPQGASDYLVAKDNLGVFPGLTAGAALLIDYTLTVAVSVSAGGPPSPPPSRCCTRTGSSSGSDWSCSLRWRTSAACGSPGVSSRCGAISSSAATSS